MIKEQPAIFDVLLHTGPTPTRAYPDDAGFDLTVSQTWTVAPHGITRIPLAQTIKSAEGHWSLLIGRSSTFMKGLLLNTGVIDPGYTGPLFAVVHNLTGHEVVVEAGERIAQLIPMPNAAETHITMRVDQLPDTDRGSNGFGSSGK